MLPNKGNTRRRMATQVNQKITKKVGIYVYLKNTLGAVAYYEPNFHLDDHNTLTEFEAFVNLVKCTFGTGMLAMPRAFYNSGWLVGLMGAFLIGSLMVYAVHVLLNDIRLLCKQYRIRSLSYSEAMRLAILDGPAWLRPLNRYFAFQVDFFMCANNFGVCVVYVVFIGKNLKILGDIYITPIDTRIYIALMTVPLVLIFTIRSFKSLVTFSIISCVLMFACFCLVLKYLLADLPSLSERKAIQSLDHLPMYFGTLMFSVAPVAMVIVLENKMESPNRFLGKFGVLNRAMAFVIVFHAIFGFLGYWQWGDETLSSILYNLPMDETFSHCIIGLYAISIFYNYALQGYVVVEIIWRIYMKPTLVEDTKEFLEYLVRMAIVLASVLCAIATPDFALLLSLVGAFCLAQLGFIFPGIINICTCYVEGYGPCKIFLWRSLFLIAIGMFGGITGSMTTLIGLKDHFDNRIFLFLSYFQISY